MTPSRSRRSDAVHNRAVVLAAACELFAERGLAAGIADVAHRACVGTGTVYRHFPSKEVLIEAVALDGLEHLQDLVVHAGESAPRAHQRLQAKLLALFDGLVTNRILLDSVVWQVTSASELDRQRARLREVVAEALMESQSDGDVRDDVTAADVVTLVSSLARPGTAPGTDARRHLDIALDGLRAAAKTQPSP